MSTHPPVDPDTASARDLVAELEAGRISSPALVVQHLTRLDDLDRAGPGLRSVLAVDPTAPAQAAAADQRRRAGGRGPLLGLPVLIKDNVDVAGLPTTAGSLALRGSVPRGDAFVVSRLRDAGAVVLGKTNLTEWANYMADDMPSGYSALGGQVLNPYDASITPSGSSSGSAAAVAAGLAPLAIGTETNGSILAPACACSVVGVKPTVGLVSRRGVVPISVTQDTAGPMARTVWDCAALLSVIAGPDPADPATSDAPVGVDYTAALEAGALRGKRIGVVGGDLPDGGEGPWRRAQEVMASLGADLFPVELGGHSAGQYVMDHEFRPALDAYLASLGPSAPVRTLAEVVAFNEAHAGEELKFGQARLEAALAIDHDDPSTAARHLEARRTDLAYGRDEVDRAMERDGLDALVFPGPASCDRGARSGYPSVAVPAGYTAGYRRPFGVTFHGPAWSEGWLLSFAYAYEQAAAVWRPPALVNPAQFRLRP